MSQAADSIELGVCGRTRSDESFVRKFRVDSFFLQDTGKHGTWSFAAHTDYGLIRGKLKWEQGDNHWVPYQVGFNSDTKCLEAAIYFSEDREHFIEHESQLLHDLDADSLHLEATITFALDLPNPVAAWNSLTA